MFLHVFVVLLRLDWMPTKIKDLIKNEPKCSSNQKARHHRHQYAPIGTNEVNAMIILHKSKRTIGTTLICCTQNDHCCLKPKTATA